MPVQTHLASIILTLHAEKFCHSPIDPPLAAGWLVTHAIARAPNIH